MSTYKSSVNLANFNWKSALGCVAILVFGLLTGGGIGLSVAPNDQGETVLSVEGNFSMELSDTQAVATIETADGNIEVIEAPTVEEVDGGELTECPEDEDCGQGAFVPVDVTSPTTIKDSTLGKCIDVDGYYGSQCTDLSAATSENMTGRRLTTCGTGAAKGMMNCWEKNADDDFEVVWDPTLLQPGDILVLEGGQYGHTGIAMGYFNEGYITLLGTNQGGQKCAGGGSSANIINISLKNFLGAYRWKNYIKPEPTPEPELPLPLSNCVKWHVLRGDTMSKIMLECENTVKYGEAMNAYAKTWYSLIYKPGQSVYDGWHSKSGVGLYAGDDIEHRTE